MLRKSIKFIFVLMALTLFLTPAWGSVSDTKDTKDQDLSFFRNHELAGPCVWVEFFEHRPVLARGGGPGGGSGGGYGGGSGGGYGNSGYHRMGSQGTDASQQQHQYQHRKTNKKQNQHQHRQKEGSGTQNQNQHQNQYQHSEESGAQN